MEERVQIIYDGSCFTVNTYNGNKPMYIFEHQIETELHYSEKFQEMRLPKIKSISVICYKFEEATMFNDLRNEYISLKEELKEYIKNRL